MPSFFVRGSASESVFRRAPSPFAPGSTGCVPTNRIVPFEAKAFAGTSTMKVSAHGVESFWAIPNCPNMKYRASFEKPRLTNWATSPAEAASAARKNNTQTRASRFDIGAPCTNIDGTAVFYRRIWEAKDSGNVSDDCTCPRRRRSGLQEGARPQLPDLDPEVRGEGTNLSHQVLEVWMVEALLPVRQGHGGIGMDLHDDPVRARGQGGKGGRGNVVPVPHGVAGIHEDRQVAEPLDDGHGCDVQRVAGLGLECPDAPLAQNDVGVAPLHDVFRREKELFDRSHHAPLQKHWPARLPDCPQEREVLHVARPHLEDARVAPHEVHVVLRHDLRHDRQPVPPRRGAQDFQSLL